MLHATGASTAWMSCSALVFFVLLDELFRPVDRVDFEPVRRERVLVDRVV
jgi:hypothetical protein